MQEPGGDNSGVSARRRTSSLNVSTIMLGHRYSNGTGYPKKSAESRLSISQETRNASVCSAVQRLVEADDMIFVETTVPATSTVCH